LSTELAAPADLDYVSAMRLVLLLALTACGPAIQETRMAYYAPRPDNCALDIINGAMTDMSIMATPTSKYVIVGSIGLGEGGTQDPFSDKYMAIVRPRACHMGGDAVALMMSATTSGGGTGTAYAILHKRYIAPAS
jgi:hypothetical protein